MNAFLPASAAPLRSNQNEMSRYEQSPTPSQPRKVTRKLDPRTRIEHRRRRTGSCRRRSGEPLVAVHVADREDVDERATTVTNRIERDRERVDEEAHVDVQTARREPGEQRRRRARAPRREDRAARRTSPATRGTRAPSARSRSSRRAARRSAPNEQEHDRADQRQQRDDPR